MEIVDETRRHARPGSLVMVIEALRRVSLIPWEMFDLKFIEDVAAGMDMADEGGAHPDPGIAAMMDKLEACFPGQFSLGEKVIMASATQMARRQSEDSPFIEKIAAQITMDLGHKLRVLSPKKMAAAEATFEKGSM